MKIIKYIFIPIILILSLSLFLFNHNSKPKNIENIDISIYDGLSSILFFIAKDLDYFEKEGLNLNFRLHNSGKKAVDSLLKGKVKYANSSEFVAVKNSFQNSTFNIIASTSEASINGIIVKKNRFTELLDIKNKSIAMSIGTASEYYTGVFLEHIGLSMNQISITNLQPNKVNDFINNKDIDGFFTWEPHIYNTLKDNSDALAFLPMPKGYEFYFSLIVDKQELKENTYVSERIIRALIQAEKWMNENPKKFKEFVMNKFNFDNAYYEYIIPNYNITVSLSNNMLETMKNEVTWLIVNNLVEDKDSNNYLNLINPKILMKIDKSLISIVK